MDPSERDATERAVRLSIAANNEIAVDNDHNLSTLTPATHHARAKPTATSSFDVQKDIGKKGFGDARIRDFIDLTGQRRKRHGPPQKRLRKATSIDNLGERQNARTNDPNAKFALSPVSNNWIVSTPADFSHDSQIAQHQRSTSFAERRTNNLGSNQMRSPTRATSQLPDVEYFVINSQSREIIPPFGVGQTISFAEWRAKNLRSNMLHSPPPPPPPVATRQVHLADLRENNYRSKLVKSLLPAPPQLPPPQPSLHPYHPSYVFPEARNVVASASQMLPPPVYYRQGEDSLHGGSNNMGSASAIFNEERSRSGFSHSSGPHQNIGDRAQMSNIPAVHQRTQQLRSISAHRRKNSQQIHQQVMLSMHGRSSQSAGTLNTAVGEIPRAAIPLQMNPSSVKNKPLLQSFLGIDKILSALQSASASAEVEVGLLKSKLDASAPGLSGRGTRLLIMQAEAKIVGLEDFIKRLVEVNLQPRMRGNQGFAEGQGLSGEPKYRHLLRLDVFELGLATEDLVSKLIFYIHDAKRKNEERSKSAESVRQQIDSGGGKRLEDVYRAWNVEVAELRSRIVCLQFCLDRLNAEFKNWERKARIEELTLPPPAEPGSFDDFPEPSVEYYQISDESAIGSGQSPSGLRNESLERLDQSDAGPRRLLSSPVFDSHGHMDYSAESSRLLSSPSAGSCEDSEEHRAGPGRLLFSPSPER